MYWLLFTYEYENINKYPLWFSKQWRNFFVADRVLTWEILERISFVKWDGEERLDTVSQWISPAVYPILRDHIPYFVQPKCVVSFLFFRPYNPKIGSLKRRLHQYSLAHFAEWMHMPIDPSLTNRQITETTGWNWSWEFDFRHSGQEGSGSLWESSAQRHTNQRYGGSFPSGVVQFTQLMESILMLAEILPCICVSLGSGTFICL